MQASNCIGFNSTFLIRVTQLNLRQITLVAKEISKKVFCFDLGDNCEAKKGLSRWYKLTISLPDFVVFELHGHIDTTHRFTSYQFCRSLLFTKRSKRSLRISKQFGNEPLKRQPNILCLLNSSDPYNVLVCRPIRTLSQTFFKEKTNLICILQLFHCHEQELNLNTLLFVDTLFLLMSFQIGGAFYDRKLSKKCQLLL